VNGNEINNFVPVLLFLFKSSIIK